MVQRFPRLYWHNKRICEIDERKGLIMEFTGFIIEICRKVRDRLGEGYDVDIQRIPKNNGLTLTGLSICRNGKKLAMTVKLDPYFGQMGIGMTTEEAVADIIKTYQGSETPDIRPSDVLDFQRVKNKIACKLINANANREMLKSVPHINWLDLSIVFYMMLGQSESGQMTAMICLEHMEMWGTTAEELCQIAYKNMEHLLPLKIMTMTEVMKEMMQKNLGEAFTEELEDGLEDMGGIKPIYLLTNNVGLHGACYMIPGLGIEQFAEEIGQDLVVIPSSIHEVLTVPYEAGMDLAYMSHMVQNINRENVPKEDWLSDRVYYYDRKEGMLMVSDCGEIQWKTARQKSKEE